MAVGAYMTYKLTTAFPEINIIIVFILAGLISACVGLLFGIPSLRIKGFYLAVATLASQFFLVWMFNKVAWFYNYNSSGTITAPPRELFGITVTGPTATAETRYIVVLAIVCVFALIAKNLVRGRLGRSWMAVRDIDIAAEIIGIRPFQTKLIAFSISSFYCGLASGIPDPPSREGSADPELFPCRHLDDEISKIVNFSKSGRPQGQSKSEKHFFVCSKLWV